MLAAKRRAITSPRPCTICQPQHTSNPATNPPIRKRYTKAPILHVNVTALHVSVEPRPAACILDPHARIPRRRRRGVVPITGPPISPAIASSKQFGRAYCILPSISLCMLISQAASLLE